VNYRSMIAALAAGAILASCSSPSSLLNANGPALGDGKVAESLSSAKTNTGSLYVSSESGVIVFSGSPAKYVRTIYKGISSPVALAFNSQKQLFVANFDINTVTVYNKDGNNPVETLSKNLKQPFYLAVSSKNDVYVGGKSHVNIYLESSQAKLRRIPVKPTGVAVDASGNAYVAGDGVITVYPPGSTKPSRTISDGIDFPTQLAIDASGNLYVGNLDPTACGSVTVYDAATGALENTITDGICEPISLAFDSLGNLYVGNEADTNSSDVTVYAVGTRALMETITEGINVPFGLSLDPSNNLYVSNYGANTVTVYPPNETSPSETLTERLSSPSRSVWIP
jgi:6-phosphogluconolactonase (cycloisomerase 2 family)